MLAIRSMPILPLLSLRSAVRPRFRPPPLRRARARGFHRAAGRSRKILRAVLTILMVNLCLAPDVSAQPEITDLNRPRIGLVLSGGGARGAAHIGVIKRLEELQVPIDLITGTSMGAIVGGLYAAGVPIEEIENWMQTADWHSLLSDRPDRARRSIRNKRDEYNYPRGLEFGLDGLSLRVRPTLIIGQKLIFELRKLALPAIDITDFDDLPIPFRAVATDILTGDSVVLDRGSLPEAIRASMAIPGLFAPIKRDGQVLVDGFLTNNLPIDLAQNMGADIIIAVNVKSPLEAESALNSPVAYSAQMLNVMGLAQDRRQINLLSPDDVYIHVLMPGQKPGDFPRAPENIEPGYAAARDHDEQLTALGVSAPEYSAWREQRDQLLINGNPLTIDEVRVAGNSRTSERGIQRRLGFRRGEVLSMPELERGLERIYDVGSFELVDFALLPTNLPDHRILELQPEDKAWGPDYLKFGLGLESDLDSDSSFNVLLNYRMTQLNRLGAEFTMEAELGEGQGYGLEFYQPLDTLGRLFVAPIARYDRQTLPAMGNVSIRNASYGSHLGMNFGPHAAVIATATRHNGKINGLFPTPVTIDSDVLSLEFIWDTIDNIYFPKSGVSFDLVVEQSRAKLNGVAAGSDSETFRGQLVWPLTRGNSTLLTYIDVSGRLDNRTGAVFSTSGLSLGGLFNLSGVPTDSIDGDSAVIGRLIYYHHLAEFSPLLGEGVYLGGSLEAGNAWEGNRYHLDDLVYAGSVFLGIDTLVGPLYFAYGHADGFDNSLYFYLGQTF